MKRATAWCLAGQDWILLDMTQRVRCTTAFISRFPVFEYSSLVFFCCCCGGGGGFSLVVVVGSNIQLVPKAALLRNLQRKIAKCGTSVWETIVGRIPARPEDLFVSEVNWGLQIEIDWESLVDEWRSIRDTTVRALSTYLPATVPNLWTSTRYASESNSINSTNWYRIIWYTTSLWPLSHFRCHTHILPADAICVFGPQSIAEGRVKKCFSNIQLWRSRHDGGFSWKLIPRMKLLICQ